ncbi:ESPR-type extended signal peptide-containing protein, partial [Pseudomonas sp. IT-P258]|uniref:ESPR-type extended signal peptide-containing protein n=1 Tax=Pseudomonas sp. IT-P258 TaxID=3026447 RepID=UPI0039E0115C
MNHIYQLVWNATMGAWVVACEFATSKGKGKSGSRLSKSLSAQVLASIAVLGATGQAHAWTATGTATSVADSNLSTNTVVGQNASTGGGYGVTNNIWPTGLGNTAIYGQTIYSTAVGNGASASFGSVALGDRAAANTSPMSIAIGSYAKSTSMGGIAIGTGAITTGQDALSAGVAATASNRGAIAFGTGSLASGFGSTAIGLDTRATADQAISIGGSGAVGAQGANASAAQAAAIGSNSLASAQKAMAIGVNASATANSGIAIGVGATANQVGGVALGVNAISDIAARAGLDPKTGMASTSASNVWKSTQAAVSIGNTTDTRQITHLAAGLDDTDAVNVAQLKALADTSLTFAGNAGSVAKKLGETLGIVGKASTAGAYSGNNLKTEADPVTGEIKLQMADAPKFGNVTINDSGSGKITGLTAGTADTDAVNVSQLNKVADISVKYDTNIDGSVNYNNITLGGDTYNSVSKTGGTKITNIARG